MTISSILVLADCSLYPEISQNWVCFLLYLSPGQIKKQNKTCTKTNLTCPMLAWPENTAYITPIISQVDQPILAYLTLSLYLTVNSSMIVLFSSGLYDSKLF